MSDPMIHFTQTSIRLIETHWQSYATIKKPVSVIGTKKNKPKIGRYWFLVVISMIGLACRHLGKKFGASAILCVFRIIHLGLGQVKLIWRICPLLHNIMYQIDCCKLRCWRRLVYLCFYNVLEMLVHMWNKAMHRSFYLVWIISGVNNRGKQCLLHNKIRCFKDRDYLTYWTYSFTEYW